MEIIEFPLYIRDSGISSFTAQLTREDVYPRPSSSFGYFDEITSVGTTLRNSGRFPAIDSEEGRLLVRFGQELFGKIFSGEMGEAFGEALSTDAVVALSFKVDSRELSVLPLELMHDGEMFLFENDQVAFSREPSLTRKLVAPPLDDIVRISVIIAESSDPAFNGDAEEELFRKALAGPVDEGMLKLSLKRVSTLDEAVDAATKKRAEILHLVSSGRYDRNLGRSVLEIGGRNVETQNLSTALALKPGLRFAAFSSPVSSSRRNPAVFKLSDYLLIETCSGALISGFPLKGDEWRSFFGVFYEELARGARLDWAAASARRSLLEMGALTSCMPILFQRDALALAPGDPGKREATVKISKLEELAARADGRQKALFTGKLAQTYKKNGKLEEALDAFESAARLFAEQGDEYNQAVAENNRGTILMVRKRFSEAAEVLDTCLSIREKVAPEEEVMVALSKLGYCHVKLENYEDSAAYYEKALELARRCAGGKGLADALFNYGAACNKLGRAVEAEELFCEAATILEEIADLPALADVYSHLGAIYLHHNEYEAAIEIFNECLGIQNSIRDLPGAALTLNNLGNAYRRIKRYKSAFEAYQAAIGMFEKKGNTKGLAGALHNLAFIYGKMEKYDEAVYAALRARDIAEKAGGMNKIVTVAEKLLDEFHGEMGKELFRQEMNRAKDRLRTLGRG